MRPYKLEIVNPERVVVDEEVESVVIPAVGGGLGILYGHVPVLGALDIGVIRYRQNGQLHKVACSLGVFEMKDNVLRILADTAERGEDIDLMRAQEARRRAEERLREKSEDLDVARAELSLRRAIARIKAASQSER